MKTKQSASNLIVTCALTGALFAAGPGLVAQEAASAGLSVLTLEGAVALALTNNPGVSASAARVDAAGGRARQAGRWSNPALELSVEEWPVSGGGRFSDAKQTIGVSQELPFPGKKALDRQLGAANVRMSEGALALRRTELVRDVKASFFQLLAAQNAVEVSSQLLSVAESSAAAARKRVDAGAAPYQEQLRAEVQLEQARTELRELERARAGVRQTFLMILGRPDLEAVQVSGTLEPGTKTTLLLDPTEERLAAHPSVLAARANVGQARLAYRRAKLEPYPDVSVGVAGGRLGETDQSIIEFGVSIPMPLLDAGKGRQQEAHANLRAAQAELQIVTQALHREWETTLERYRSAIEQVNRYQQAIVPKSDEALRLVRTGFEEGKFGFIDLLDTQRTAAESQLNYQAKLLELQIARAELEALVHPQPIEVSVTTKEEE